DPDLAEEIKKRMFIFDDIVILDNRAIQRIIREVEADDLRLRSEEHTSELQSRFDLVCRLLLEKKKTKVEMVEVIKAFKRKPDCHCTSKYLSNLIEKDDRQIKVRETRYDTINTEKTT